ncbi:MAG: thiamine pyrophosphate-dependent enzyme [Propionicimonas sp.]|uniref:thiamine pyrophosphate-dependent enzyme n=1 Tax=Propionicimonas sp. TaxID=1955623 RepID=UPI003D104F0F
MPKSLAVNPAEVRKASTITVPPIPVNAYKLDFTAARKRYGADGLVAMLHDMIAIREFESMLNSIKTTGGWQGIEYNHKGPAHLSAGQEAAAVGQAAELDADDYIFGSHRSHGEILGQVVLRGPEDGRVEARRHDEHLPRRRHPALRREDRLRDGR